jgi:signal transduction histidine kinase
MRLRLEQLGGRLEIKSGRTGTRVTATLALDRDIHPDAAGPG